MRRTDLALRALRLMDRSDGMLRSTELAEELHSTPQFMPQVMTPLVRAGWVASEPGPKGGYQLATDLSERSILELIELIEGPTDDGHCVLKGGPCDDSPRCALHDAWQSARDALLTELRNIPISTGQAARAGRPDPSRAGAGRRKGRTR